MIKVKDKSALKLFDDYEALNIKGVIKNTDYEVYTDDIENPKGIWIKDRYFNFLYSRDNGFIEDFSSSIKDDFFGFSGTTIEAYKYFLEHELIQWKNTCIQYHFTGGKFDVEALESLKVSDADYVNDHYEYKNDDSLDKIKEAILNRPSGCIRVNGVLVSFVMLHDDDSIGYMYTLPEYRGKGYAYKLTMDIVNKTIDSGRLPYIQIVEGNHKSEQLALKAGFVKHGTVEWFGVVKIDGQFKEYIDKYEDLMGEKALSVSTLCQLQETYQVLDVTVEDHKLKYDGQTYDFEYIYDDEIYYLKSDLPEDLLVSGLMKVMKEDYEMCLVNMRVDNSAFKKVMNT